MKQLEQLRNKWLGEDVKLPEPANDNELTIFQLNNKITLPIDLINYFKILNGTGEEYDGDLFQFYSFDRMNKIGDEYKDWRGVPNYINIVNTLIEFDEYYVIANYSFQLFAYAIKLYAEESENNEVIVICGDKYRKIANSFSEFIYLYLNKSFELQF